MYAIIETGGKQYRVQEGDVITVEKLNVKDGEIVTFDKVLLISDGDSVKTGTPYLSETVKGIAVESGKGKKVIIFKYKAKKDYRKKQGHRQPYTTVQIDSIGASAAPKAAAPKAAAAKKAAPAKEGSKKEEPKKAEPKKEPAKKEESKKEPAKKVSASMKKDELIAFAKENGIAIDEKATKAVIIEAIEAGLK